MNLKKLYWRPPVTSSLAWHMTSTGTGELEWLVGLADPTRFGNASNANSDSPGAFGRAQGKMRTDT